MLELEQRRREINRNMIHPEIRELTLQVMEPIICSVAQVRAAYVQSLFDLVEQADGLPTPEDIDRLRERRCALDEMVAAVNALETMIERGYVDAVATQSTATLARANV